MTAALIRNVGSVPYFGLVLALGLMWWIGNALYYGLAMALGLFCWFQWRYRRLLRVAAGLPTIYPAWPLLGHGYFMARGLVVGTDYMLAMSRAAVAKGLSTICFWVGPLPLLMVNSLEDVRLLMNSSKTLDKSDEYEFFKEGLDTAVGPLECSMLTSPGPVWKATRRHINTMFTPRNLDQMTPVFNGNARALLARLENRVAHGPAQVDMIDFVMDSALKAICDFLFGIDNNIKIESRDFQDLKHIVDGLSENFVKRTTQPWLRWYPLFYILNRKSIEENNRIWKNFTNTHLKVTKEQYEQKILNSITEMFDGTTSEKSQEKPLTIVEVYKQLQEKNPLFKENDMWGEMLTLYETGSDSVAVTTSICLMALAQHPDCQEKVYQEVCSVVGPDDDVTLEHAKKLTYTYQCIKETLRRFTLVPFLMRKPTEDIKISDCTIPAGSTIVMSVYAVHMNPRLYPEPEKFDPDRFSAENVASRDKFSFIAFSGGPRDCVGKEYAKLYCKVLLAQILRKYKVKPVVDVHKLKRKLSVVLVSSEGYFVELEPRNS